MYICVVIGNVLILYALTAITYIHISRLTVMSREAKEELHTLQRPLDKRT